MLSENQLYELAKSTKSNKLDKLSKKEKDQFMDFMFGADFMKSKDKGSLRDYKSKNGGIDGCK